MNCETFWNRHYQHPRNYIPGGVHFGGSCPQSFSFMKVSEIDILKNPRNYIPGGVYFRRSRPQSFLVMILSERDILKNQRNDIPGSTKLGQKFPRKLSFVSKQECSAIKFASPIHFVRRND